jgi:hypothetical protein
LRGCRKVKETRRKLGWIGMDCDAIRFDGFFWDWMGKQM